MITTPSLRELKTELDRLAVILESLQRVVDEQIAAGQAANDDPVTDFLNGEYRGGRG